MGGFQRSCESGSNLPTKEMDSALSNNTAVPGKRRVPRAASTEPAQVLHSQQNLVSNVRQFTCWESQGHTKVRVRNCAPAHTQSSLGGHPTALGP